MAVKTEAERPALGRAKIVSIIRQSPGLGAAMAVLPAFRMGTLLGGATSGTAAFAKS